MKSEISECKARIKAYKEDVVSKDLPVFYNPVMKLNRDISVLLLNAIDKKDMQIALPMAASGIRGIRFLLELDEGKVKRLAFNDMSSEAIYSVKENLSLNGLDGDPSIDFYQKDANIFMLESSGFDYIDIDPFGTPNPFLDAAIKRISRNGILAVTATDTSALSGTYPKATLRKYWATSHKCGMMHELGLRMLIRKVQLIGAENEKALVPVFSYSKDHYYRIFFRCDKGKTKADNILNQHGWLVYCRHCLDRHVTKTIQNEKTCRVCGKDVTYAGPMWLGKLWDKGLAKKMMESNHSREILENETFFKTIEEESGSDEVGFFDIHEIASLYKTKGIPKTEILMERLREKGVDVSRTHFKGEGIRADCTISFLVKTLGSL